MYLCAGVLFAGFIGYVICYRLGKRQQIGIYFLIVMFSGAFALLACLNEDYTGETVEIKRNEPGEGSITREYLIEAEDILSQEPYEVVVDNRHITGQELTELFEQAAAELEQNFLGENESLDHINQDVSLVSKVKNGLVKVSWNFDRYTAVDSNGKLIDEGIDDAGTLVGVTATLSYEKITVDHHFSIMVYPREKSAVEKFHDALDEAVRLSNAQPGEYFRLPEQIEGTTVEWTPQFRSQRYLILMLGLFSLAGVAIGRKQDERREKKARQELLTAEYPKMLSKFSLLLGAGMTVSGAWERIVQSYERQKESNLKDAVEQPVYEEMCITYHQIHDGMGERAAYEEFGSRIQLQNYRKFAALLTQNLRKGTVGLSKILDKEVEEAAKDQEAMLKKRGEELETKLLLPMMLMLGLVIVIILIPAIITFNV